MAWARCATYGDRRICCKLPREAGHFDRAQPCFVALVPALAARAVDGLLERIARQDAESHGHARIELYELNAARCLGTNIIVVRCFSPKNAADADDRIDRK